MFLRQDLGPNILPQTLVHITFDHWSKGAVKYIKLHKLYNDSVINQHAAFTVD